MQNRDYYIEAIWIYLKTVYCAYLNMLAVFIFAYSMAHNSGELSELAVAIASTRINTIESMIGIAVSFVAGSILGGIINKGERFNFQYRFGFMQYIMCGLLILIEFVFANQLIQIFMLAFIFGIENSLILKIRSSNVKLTYMTGTLITIGITISEIIRKQYSNLWLLYYSLFVIFCYILGSFLGAIAYLHNKESAFKYGIMASFILGTIYLIYSYFYKKKHI